jgi:plastocyanin
MTAALVGAAPTAVGGGSTIQAAGTSFTPAKTTVSQGTTVTWSFSGTHTTTSNDKFWDSNLKPNGSSFSKKMPSAGRFPYHCTVHSGMNGRIVVPLKASGSAGSGWTLRWAASAAANGRAFDVQFRRQGTTEWRAFRTDTTAATGFFNRTRTGTYELRARTSNTAADKESGWSPVLRREIS